MPTWFVQIRMLQSEPFPMAADSQGRAQFAFNVLAEKMPSADTELDLVNRLVSQSVGVFEGSDRTIFKGLQAVLPNGDGPYLTVKSSGGAGPLQVQNRTGDQAYRRPTLQIVVCGKSVAATRAKAQAAYNALASVLNMSL